MCSFLCIYGTRSLKSLFLSVFFIIILGDKIDIFNRFRAIEDKFTSSRGVISLVIDLSSTKNRTFMGDFSESELLSIPIDNTNITRMYRSRSALARALFEKQRNDEELRSVDKTEWYRVEHERLTPELEEKFIQLHPDSETREFIAQSIEKSSWIWTQLWHTFAKTILQYFWSITDINGWLQRGSMFVLSQDQAKKMLCPPDGSASGGVMLDLGAGDGEVSLRWRSLFTQQFATEISASMRSLLTDKGFCVVDADSWYRDHQKYDQVHMLNLLDRCSKPITMLRQAKEALKPNGYIVVALVLPYRPYVEVTRDHKPEENLGIKGKNFEEQVTYFVNFMRDELKLNLLRWSRVPYLCEGDFSQSYYWLNDSFFVFEAL